MRSGTPHCMSSLNEPHVCGICRRQFLAELVFNAAALNLLDQLPVLASDTHWTSHEADVHSDGIGSRCRSGVPCVHTRHAWHLQSVVKCNGSSGPTGTLQPGLLHRHNSIKQRQQCSLGSGRACQQRPPRDPPLQAEHMLLVLCKAELVANPQLGRHGNQQGRHLVWRHQRLVLDKAVLSQGRDPRWLSEPACAQECQAAGMSGAHRRVRPAQHCLQCPHLCML